MNLQSMVRVGLMESRDKCYIVFSPSPGRLSSIIHTVFVSLIMSVLL